MINLTQKTEDAAAYVARCKCGCTGIIMATVDLPEHADVTAEEVADCIRDGYAVERTTVVYVREFSREHGLGCIVEKAAREAKAAALTIAPGTLVMTNFVTGEAVPAGRVPNSQAGEPTAAYVAGFRAGMDGELKAAPFELSNLDAGDWLAGYEDGEMD